MQLVVPTGIWVALLPVAPLPLWQLAQLVAPVKPLWSTLAPSQLVVDLWQFSQTVWPLCTAVVGLMLAWQVAHWLVTASCVWFQRLGFHAVVLWQAMQFVVPTGMWVALLPVAPLPLWQLAQLVAAVKPLWSTLAPNQLVVDLWQFSHTVWPLCTAVVGLMLAWQVAH